MLALKLFHSARTLSPEEVAGIASQALELLPPKHHVRGAIQMVSAGLQMVLGDMKSALPNLERSVDEARRAQSPSFLAGVLVHHGQVCVAMGRLEDGRRSYEEALLAGRKVSTEANLLMCGPHTGLAEVLLGRADLAGATHHAAKALEFASKSPTRSPVLYARTTAAQVLLAAGDTKAAIEQLEEVRAFAPSPRFSSFLSSVKLKIYFKIYCRSGDLEAAADVARDQELSPDVAVDRNNAEEMTAYARYLVARATMVMRRKFSQGCSRSCGAADRCNTRSTRSCSRHWRMRYWARGRLPSSRSDGRPCWASRGVSIGRLRAKAH